MRICVSLGPGNESMFAMCIFFPHRHSGNSVEPDAKERSNADTGNTSWEE
jgi:hypothetical protein